MPAYETLKHQLTRISEDTASLIDNAERITELVEEGLSQWKATCQTISEQISEEMMRVAVVGAIKSGKSTFVNPFLAAITSKGGPGWSLLSLPG